MAIMNNMNTGYKIINQTYKMTKMENNEGNVIVLSLRIDDDTVVPFILGFFLNIIGVLISGLAFEKNPNRWKWSFIGLATSIIIGIIIMSILAGGIFSVLSHL